MKYLIKFTFVVILIILSVSLCYGANTEDVTLTVTSEDITKDEAIKNALRSAIEQTYGVFVSTNTSILNDDIVRDEIATISSGNIKSYKELGCAQLSNSKVSVTLQAEVSINKLISYAKSKGAECTFDGAAFAMNVMLKELNEENERKALNDLSQLIIASLTNMYDVGIAIDDQWTQELRDLEENIYGYAFYAQISFKGNKNLSTLWTMIKNTLESISLPCKDFISSTEYGSNRKRLISDPLTMQLLTKQSRSYPVATVYANFGSRVLDQYDDPYDKAKADKINTAICFTRRDSSKWEEELQNSLLKKLQAMSIKNQNNQNVSYDIVSDDFPQNQILGTFSGYSGTGFLRQYSHNPYSRMITVFPQEFSLIVRLVVPKSQLKEFKSLRVEFE